MATKDGKGRTRNYATVVYPESAPDDWMNVLREKAISAFISPLHDQDLNPTGEHKKPHYHVMIMFDNVKSPDQAKEIFDQIGGVGCEKVGSTRGYARYLCHLDNPEKHQYPTASVISCGGADYMETIGLITDTSTCLKEMMQFCEEHDNVSFHKLALYASLYNESWFRVISQRATLFMKEWLKSREYTKRGQVAEDALKEVEKWHTGENE